MGTFGQSGNIFVWSAHGDDCRTFEVSTLNLWETNPCLVEIAFFTEPNLENGM